MIPLEAALDIQNHPEKYAQLGQEKLEKELAQSGATVERDKWLHHPCTKSLVEALVNERLALIDQGEKSIITPIPVCVTSTLRKVIECIRTGKYPTQLT